MVIIPEILGEAEFRFFNDTDFECLKDVLDDSLAKYLKTYFENPEANPEIVARIKEKIGDAVESLTMHYVLQEKGIISLLASLSPETLMNSGTDLEEIRVKLKFLEDNIDKVRVTISARPKAAYDNFKTSISGVIHRMMLEGVETTFPEVLARLDSNRFLFYVPNDKGHTTGVSIVNTKRRQWVMCLRGIEYKQYCDNNGIDYITRRYFNA